MATKKKIATKKRATQKSTAKKTVKKTKNKKVVLIKNIKEKSSKLKKAQNLMLVAENAMKVINYSQEFSQVYFYPKNEIGRYKEALSMHQKDFMQKIPYAMKLLAADCKRKASDIMEEIKVSKEEEQDESKQGTAA